MAEILEEELSFQESEMVALREMNRTALFLHEQYLDGDCDISCSSISIDYM